MAGAEKLAGTMPAVAVAAVREAGGKGAIDWMQWHEITGPPLAQGVAIESQRIAGHWHAPSKPTSIVQAEAGRATAAPSTNIKAIARQRRVID